MSGKDPKSEAIATLVAEFAAPSAETSAWLRDPRLAATLETVSARLAPDGKAEDSASRYAASVIETHLMARRRLTGGVNGLLKP